MSDEIKEIFAEEAEELFDGISPVLLEAEEAKVLNDNDLILLFRNVHTLKGGAGSVGFVYFTEYLHHLESFMDDLRNHKIESNEKIIDFIITHIDKAKEIFEEEVYGNLDEQIFAEDLKELRKNIEAFSNPSTPTHQTKTRDISLEYVDELLDMFNEVFHILSVAKHEGHDSIDTGELFRLVHSIKGSASVLSQNWKQAADSHPLGRSAVLKNVTHSLW